MLLRRRASVAERLWLLAGATLLACAPVIVWAVLAAVGVADWPVASSYLGVVLGLVGAGIIVFEMALVLRKWWFRGGTAKVCAMAGLIRREGTSTADAGTPYLFRGWNFFPVRYWLWTHIVLGLAVLPIIVIHSGFAFGGFLSAATMVLFLAVIASGIYGLALQQWLPHKIQMDVPEETIAAEADTAATLHVVEAERLVNETRSDNLTVFFEGSLKPYLQHGRRSASPMRHAAEVARQFGSLRRQLPMAHEVLRQLERLAQLRREWDRQRTLHRWLHNWLAVHLPLSVLMTGLMVVHALYAMKWW